MQAEEATLRYEDSEGHHRVQQQYPDQFEQGFQWVVNIPVDGVIQQRARLEGAGNDVYMGDLAFDTSGKVIPNYGAILVKERRPQ